MKHLFAVILFCFACNYLYAQACTILLKEVPDYKIVNSSGAVINMQELTRNKTAFINFWFIPCGPFLAEMSMLDQLYSQYKSDSNIVFISVTASNPEAVKNMLTTSSDDTSMFPLFKQIAKLDTVNFPIYYVHSCMDIVKKSGPGLVNYKIISPEKIDCPYDVFKFSAYPTNFIIDKSGTVIYQHTGFVFSEKKKQYKQITRLIEEALKAVNK